VSLRLRLKPLHVFTNNGTVVVYRRPTEPLYLSDGNGRVDALVRLLAQGTHTIEDLPAELTRRGYPASASEVREAVRALDSLGVLERADAPVEPEVARWHEGNLRFYDLYTDLRRSSADLHRSVAGSSVLLIGAGPLGAGVLQALLGLGVGRVRIVDRGLVEARHVASQFAYGTHDIGQPTVAAAAAWARRYAPASTVEPVRAPVTGSEDVRALADGTDLVVLATDRPAGIELFTNEACFALKLPYITGGFALSTLYYWSVAPGRTPCRRCLALHRAGEPPAPPLDDDPVDRTTGPVAQLLAGLISLEAQRYLARTEEPVAAATYQVIDVGDRMRPDSMAWPYHPDCDLCA
jgi:molybdopterin/thiamine biosynthesis adenylyltransferase